ncbi:MAG: endonuclease MutS2 [Oscillospiraceae bacterium]|jgi:DNA mismatch repair protein MutS2|nr:endonuclease MutS2 [Oscillospiraceae bacterium]
MEIVDGQKHLKTLELDKVLAMLSELTACGDARQLALGLKPESDLFLARLLLDQTVRAYTRMARHGGPPFGGLMNVSNALRRAEAGAVLTMRQLLEIAQLLRVFRALTAWRDNSAGEPDCLDVYLGGVSANSYLENAIGAAILSEDQMADQASPTLADIRRKIRQAESGVRSRLEQMIRSPSYQKYLQENLITLRGGRFVVPVKAEHRGAIPGMVHDASASGSTIFVEPMAVVEANNEIKVLQGREREEIERVLAELSALAGSFAAQIAASYDCAVELDVIFAKARLAYDMKAAAPAISDDGTIVLNRARHPLIERSTVVPIDVTLGIDFDQLVVTGPNTGGKTVTLKTIGLLSLMAMCGLMIPAADGCKLSVFEHVLADIGDEQSIEQSLSTFSSHMKNLIDILAVANQKSLVLIDELGAGTDPAEGAALAMSILDHLRHNGAKIAATTHYAELKAYALQTQGVENACCEFDVQTLRPTYRLLIGVPGRSNAFAIASRLGMPSAIVEHAKSFTSAETAHFEKVIARLEERLQIAEQSQEDARKLREQAMQALASAESAKDEVKKFRDKALEDARKDGERIADRTKREAYALLAELDRLKKQMQEKPDAQLAKRARTLVKNSVAELAAAGREAARDELDDADDTLHRPLRVGDRVRLRDMQCQAEVLKLPDAKGFVEVLAGNLRTRTPLTNIRLLGEERVIKNTRKRVEHIKEDAPSRMTLAGDTRLDLRGTTVDDCLLELDRFMDTALRTGLHEFTIVHGKGTGALRAAVQKYLRASAFVKTFRLGVYGEGETGVTIVELK